jgi:hypothetical protein
MVVEKGTTFQSAAGPLSAIENRDSSSLLTVITITAYPWRTINPETCQNDLAIEGKRSEE